MNTTWRDIDFARMTVDVALKKDTVDTREWHIKDIKRRTLPLTAERFYLVVRKDILDRARAASEASRKGQSVARLLRAPRESDEDPITLSVNDLQSKL
jgi:hypothetical protein